MEWIWKNEYIATGYMILWNFLTSTLNFLVVGLAIVRYLYVFKVYYVQYFNFWQLLIIIDRYLILFLNTICIVTQVLFKRTYSILYVSIWYNNSWRNEKWYKVFMKSEWRAPPLFKPLYMYFMTSYHAVKNGRCRMGIYTKEAWKDLLKSRN